MDPTESGIYVSYAEVIVNCLIDKTLDYGITAEMAPLIKEGSCVNVPLRKNKKAGIVVAIKDTSSCPKVLPVTEIIENNIVLSSDLIQLAIWISRYYFAPLGKILPLFLPIPVREAVTTRQQQIVSLAKTKEEVLPLLEKMTPNQKTLLTTLLSSPLPSISLIELLRMTNTPRNVLLPLVKKKLITLTKENRPDPFFDNIEFFPTQTKILNEDQKLALRKINGSLENEVFETHLLFGVTGSGKTEVYLQAIEHAHKLKKSAIVLLPEVALTVQMIKLFKARFGKSVDILHHKLSHGDRNKTWIEALQGKINIVIGPRSALFCPIKNLGLIIVDEEHDTAYKQDGTVPCYHARDTAVMRGKLSNATVVLGSATPSLESYMNAEIGKYNLSILSQKAEPSPKATVSLINMKEELPKSQSFSLFSPATLNGIESRIRKGEQILIFCNRRGYHTQISCQNCKTVLKCKHCDISLIFHKQPSQLICHLCNFTLDPPPVFCEHCKGSIHLKYSGLGTEKIEQALHSVFPRIRTIRIDADTTRQRGTHADLFKRFETGKADVLIGTQMIAKGLHFPSVTLSIILNGESGLHIPDFRSSEYVFQLITQVAGRSGRSNLPGEVFIQAFNTENKTIVLSSEMDYLKFYRNEIIGRKALNFPPFIRLIKCVCMSRNENSALSEANKIRKHIIAACPDQQQTVIYPVIPCGHVKIKDFFRYQFLIKSRNVMLTNRNIQNAMTKCKPTSKIQFLIDVDPVTTFF